MPPETLAGESGALDAGPAPKAAAAERRFTWQQLAQHNRDGDAFVAIRGKVGPAGRAGATAAASAARARPEGRDARARRSTT